MDYEQKYNELVNAIKVLQETNPSDEGIQNWVNDNVPELRKSEDEKVREDIIHLVNAHGQGRFKESMLAWLENQGTSYTKRDVDDAYVEGMAFVKYELEKQGEQKPTDKVEPKLKVGDWILYSGDHYEGVRHITKINENGYYIERNGLPHGIIPFNHEICMKLWTIQDAKDGDVIQLGAVTAIFKVCYGCERCKCYCSVYKGIFEIPTRCETYGTYNAKPATKEQRDLLFQKMKEAGYEWDANKKELKKMD